MDDNNKIFKGIATVVIGVVCVAGGIASGLLVDSRRLTITITVTIAIVTIPLRN